MPRTAIRMPSASNDTLNDELSSALTINQRLLVAQAVHSIKPAGPVDLDTLDWGRVVDLLRKYAAECEVEVMNPMVLDPGACCSAYLDSCKKYLQDSTDDSEPRPALDLARKLYEVMIKGIAEALSVEEQKSKTLASEIDEIQRGNWDDKLKNAAQRKKILHTLGVTQTADSDDVPISRSRSTTPSNPRGSVENNTGSAMHSPLGSEPSGQDSRRSTTPNAYLQVPVTRKRKTRSDSLSSARTDSTTASNKKKVTRPSPSRSPANDVVSCECSPVRASTPIRNSVQSRTRTRSPTPSVEHADPITIEPLESPDADDQIVLRELTAEAHIPLGSVNLNQSESQSCTSMSNSAQEVSITNTEGKEAEDLMESESTAYTKAHLTQATIRQHTQLELDPQASDMSRETSNNSLRLVSSEKAKQDEDQKVVEDVLSASHSPTSTKKARLELDLQIDDHCAGTPSSVSFPTGITEGSSTAQQTPVALQTTFPTPDSTALKVSTTSSAPSDSTSFRRRMMRTHSSVQNNPISAVFREPVKDNEAPGYSSIVKRPMDLRTLAKRLREGVVVSAEEYRRDLMLMLANAVMFNHEGSEVTKNAKELMVEGDRLVSIFVRGAGARY